MAAMSLGTVLVVEDDAAIRRGIVDALKYAGYRTFEAADGDSGLSAAIGADIDLVLLDILLPRRDGFAILDELRKARPALAVIVLTARGTEEDRVRGLKTGADDYVVKPFSASELLARVEAVLRRSAERPRSAGCVSVAGRTIDFERREVRFADGGSSELSEREAGILRYLAQNPGRAVTRAELLARVWGFDPRGLHTRTVDMHIARLREQLRDDPSAPRIILTVRSLGYKFAPEENAEEKRS
jgi:two-component system alkaline phosphatase synthesis response regulator PhoP